MGALHRRVCAAHSPLAAATSVTAATTVTNVTLWNFPLLLLAGPVRLALRPQGAPPLSPTPTSLAAACYLD